MSGGLGCISGASRASSELRAKVASGGAGRTCAVADAAGRIHFRLAEPGLGSSFPVSFYLRS